MGRVPERYQGIFWKETVNHYNTDNQIVVLIDPGKRFYRTAETKKNVRY